MTTLHGRCECGAVVFAVAEARQEVTFCHCSQCRRTTGHYWASTRAALKDVTFSEDRGLTWYQSSDVVRRGFCGICGSSLFYQPLGAEHYGIAVGCFDRPTGLTPGKHIFTADAGDYYMIPADAPQVPD